MSHVEETGVPAGSPTVVADGVRLAYSRAGRGPTVVCLHAVGHGGRDFEAFARLACDAFEVVCIDWPGHGRSGPDTKAPSAARYGELLSLALSQLKIERPVLLGNSIGGGAAIVHAASHPVRGLVLCNSAGLLDVTADVTRACNFMARFFAAGARGAWWFKPAFWAYYTLLVLPSAVARGQRKRIIAAGYETAAVLGTHGFRSDVRRRICAALRRHSTRLFGSPGQRATASFHSSAVCQPSRRCEMRG